MMQITIPKMKCGGCAAALIQALWKVNRDARGAR